MAAADDRVEQVIICTPDKDLGQCVVGQRVVQLDRRKGEIYDAQGVQAKFGVPPTSIPDYLALVGDSADGFPGLPGGGRRARPRSSPCYGHLEDIPPAAGQWEVPGLRGAAKLSSTLQSQLDLAVLFRRIATVECDVPVGTVDDWRWTGPTAALRGGGGDHRRPRRSPVGPAGWPPPRGPDAHHPPAEATARRSAAHERHR